MAMPITPSGTRFLRHVDKTETCWLWTGWTAGSKGKYGYFNPNEPGLPRSLPAHRFAYMLWVGPIPEGMEVDHVATKGCSSRLCVRPDHLETVTPGENSQRTRLVTCRAGLHDLTIPENQAWDSKGRRRGCIQCQRAKALRNYYLRKA